MIGYGRVMGTWKRACKKTTVTLEVSPFTSFKKTEKQTIMQTLDRYRDYLKMSIGACNFIKPS